jgi:MFS family permease
LRSRPPRIVAIVCLAEILSMTPFSMFLALQPQLQDAWSLSNTQSGWISSAYFAGYMLMVPLLGSLTDRVDARAVWLGACGLAGCGALGFAAGARDVWSAAGLQLVTGAGLAGTYMPGLKVITDRLTGVPRPRQVAFYTTSFTIGSSLSFWIVGELDAHLQWRLAVALSSVGPLTGCALVYFGLRPAAVAPHAHAPAGVHVKAVLHSRDSMRYVLGYAAHVWELFALRAWVVPFVVFCQDLRGSASPLSITTLAAVVSLVGVPASLAGAELTARFSRPRLIVAVMALSIVLSLLVVPAAVASWTALLVAVCAYSAFISADSAALTSGLVAVAPAASRGTAMAIYSTLGFAAASGGTFMVGLMLDTLGGQSVVSWTVAFALMSAPGVVGALAISGAERRGW